MELSSLEECRQLFELAQDVAHVGYWEWDIRSNEVVWSRQKIEIYGEDSGDFEPSFEKFLSVIDEETRARVMQEIDDVLAGRKKYYDLQHQIRLRNGKTAWVHEKGFVLRDEQGAPHKLIGVVYDITDRMLMMERLHDVEQHTQYLKTHDQLTGLHNKDSLHVDIHKLIRHERPFSLLFLDIDNFKTINNTYGHLFGDVVIRRVAEMMRTALPSGRLYRYGADDFVILVEGDGESPQDIVTTLDRLFERPLTILGNNLLISLSAGISRFPEDAQNARDVIKNANSALSIARQSGSHRVLQYENYMGELITSQRQTLDALHRAIAEERFEVHYQPKVDARHRCIVGFEALVRWPSETGELIPPDIFLPIAQEYDVLHQIDHIVLRKALQQLSLWHQAGHRVGLSVNFNMSDFNDQRILDLIGENSELARYLTIELTENELMACSEQDHAVIGKLKALGARVSLDDFGTGYSSLRYLHRLAIDELKVDRSFVEHLPGDRRDEDLLIIIKSIVDTFGLDCVVEGVERVEQRDHFLALGLSIIQGYLYSPPLPAEEATRLLTEGLPEPA